MNWLSPRLIPLHVGAIAALVLCGFMGLWQMGVYGAKHDDSAAQKSSAAPVDLLKVWGPDDAFTADLASRPVLVRGRFTGEQVLISRGPGRFWTVAPLRVMGTTSSLLVVRGWSGPDSPPLPQGSISFRATLQPGEPSADAIDSGIHSSVSIPSLANVFPDDLFSGYAVTASPAVTVGLKPVAAASSRVSWTVGLRNLAYAMQWWLFGLFAAFMWFRMASDAIAVSRVEPAGTVAE